MIADELEHLEAVLQKKPIVGTWTADDLLNRPELVYQNYIEHARSFVILGRLSATSGEDQPTVADYEKRLIKLVKEQGAAKGYITAEYGYGKTSTAIFIWQRCEQANILSVPPFQIQNLDHLISATYGWVRFKLARSYPQLVSEADAIYQRSVKRSIDTEASDERTRQLLYRLHDEGRYSLGLRPLDYLNFFEEMTTLAQKAQYDGLVIIADELQQYLETNKSRDALPALFNIIQALITRKGKLPFGLILSVARQDLGVMNDFRSDLVQRLKEDKLALDLSNIYNQTFARDLWDQLACELGFEAIKDEIVLPEALEALGQISARADLANGPRTVVDVFKLMSSRYKEQRGRSEPFSPIDLVDGFLRGDISYDNTGLLQRVVNEHLAQHFVQKNPDYQRAIKLMAAFPIGGLSQHLFDKYQVRRAIEDLTTEARGDIVTFAGGGYDAHGQLRETRALLVGLEDRRINTDWLTTTIRDFTRGYHEQAPYVRELAVNGFQQLLKSDIFKDGNWKVILSLEKLLTQNRAYIFEGAFTTTRKQYPERRLHVRILLEDEHVSDTSIDGDIALNFWLMFHSDQPEHLRLMLPGKITSEEDKTATFFLNMSHHSGMSYYGDLNTTLGQVVAPSTINPILLLSLYAYLDRKREAGAMPKDADEMIRSNFQPLLLDHALQELFNADIGKSANDAKGPRVVEEVVKRQLEIAYPEYKTLMTSSQWKHALRDYRDALGKLSTSAERQGKQLYARNKQELAKLFGRTTPAIDTFISNNPFLIKNEGNGWRFTLHPLEIRILNLIKGSILSEASRTGKPRPYITYEVTLARTKEAGYREEEVQEAIEMLEIRGLIALDPKRTKLIEEIARVPQVEELRTALKEYREKLSALIAALPENLQLSEWMTESDSIERIIESCMRTPDEQKQSSIELTIKKRSQGLNMLMQTEVARLADNVRPLVQRSIAKSIKIETLDKPLSDGLFADQLNNQRLKLLKDYQDIADRLEKLEKQMRALYDSLAYVSLSAIEVARSLEQYKHIQKDLQLPRERMAQVGENIQYYHQARQLLIQAQGLQQRLLSAPTDIAKPFVNALQAWSLQVTSELSSVKIGGLKREPQWREQFESIEQGFSQQLKEEETRFMSIQEDYQSFLHQAFPRVRVWPNIVFNASQPQDSYKRLWEGVHTFLEEAVKEAHMQVQAVYDRVMRLLSGLDNLPQVERSTTHTRLTDLLTEIRKYVDTTKKWVESVSNPDFITPVVKRGTTETAETVLHNVVVNITMLTEHIPEVNALITADEQRVLAAKLSAEEIAMLTLLREIARENGTLDEVELGLLFQRLGGSQAVNWQSLASLYSKQRLSVKVAPSEYE
jgi:hypothetical protein